MADVAVDLDKCIGTGMCEASAPNVFQVGDDGQAQVRTAKVAPEDLDAAKEAVANCPTGALTLHD
ncbi:ferredoxin [[Mycobacterium] burgundiense]|jgi:ferredoxin|uniref:Ferredoxin n=1 Tax=[Mycobacterium] burgundiense TaxID=3064286 RepID=A0ABM9LTK5_9MYCO|nr:ferredoxin [Mycolicibacterium sp. MU0053]CAJ1504504.1 ferredoxin [Mycolicibacterium sp. MU0053]